MQTEIPGTSRPAPRSADGFTYAQIDRVYGNLAKFKESLGPSPNRRYRAQMMIGVCIAEGFNTHYRITQAMRVMGLGKDHVLRTLSERTGDDPEVHLWRRDEDGLYHLLDAA